jgi:hypothetical protein
LTEAEGSCEDGLDEEETRREGRLFGSVPMNNSISGLNRILSKETFIDLIKDVLPILKKFEIKYGIVGN